MKNKNKIFLSVVSLFFLSVFFAGVQSVSADDCSECRNSYAGDNPDLNCMDYCGGFFDNSSGPSVPSCQSAEESSYCCNLWSGYWYNNTCNSSEQLDPWQECANSGGNWNGTRCIEPEDPMVKCSADGGVWNGYSCSRSSGQASQTYAECMAEFNRIDICGNLEGNPNSAGISQKGTVGESCIGTNTGAGICNDGLRCDSTNTCVVDGFFDGTECRDDADCFKLYGAGFECNGVFTSTCEKLPVASEPRPVATTTADTFVNGRNVRAGSQINEDGSATNTTTGEQVAPPGSFNVQNAGGNVGSLVMCVNGVLAPICTDEYGNEVGGGTPVVLGSSDNPNFVGPNLPAKPKCGTGFQEVAGVCFPVNTGLSDAPVYLILSNLFSWLMGLFTTLAVLAFVLSGIQYFMSSGDESMAETAKENAKNAIVGIIVGLSGFIIIKAITIALSGQSYFF